MHIERGVVGSGVLKGLLPDLEQTSRLAISEAATSFLTPSGSSRQCLFSHVVKTERRCDHNCRLFQSVHEREKVRGE
jgi:hypothetical protein